VFVFCAETGWTKATRDIATSAADSLLNIFWASRFTHASTASRTSDWAGI
jgi:hypothetical protein